MVVACAALSRPSPSGLACAVGIPSRAHLLERSLGKLRPCWPDMQLRAGHQDGGLRWRYDRRAALFLAAVACAVAPACGGSDAPARLQAPPPGRRLTPPAARTDAGTGAIACADAGTALPPSIVRRAELRTPARRRRGRTLLVGPGKTYTMPSAAAAVAQAGDRVLIAPGDYRGDVATWSAANLTICGDGGRARLYADGKNAQGKGIWVIAVPNSATTTIVNVEFHDAKVPDKNGAGIRARGRQPRAAQHRLLRQRERHPRRRRPGDRHDRALRVRAQRLRRRLLAQHLHRQRRPAARGGELLPRGEDRPQPEEPREGKRHREQLLHGRRRPAPPATCSIFPTAASSSCVATCCTRARRPTTRPQWPTAPSGTRGPPTPSR